MLYGNNAYSPWKVVETVIIIIFIGSDLRHCKGSMVSKALTLDSHLPLDLIGLNLHPPSLKQLVMMLLPIDLPHLLSGGGAA